MWVVDIVGTGRCLTRNKNTLIENEKDKRSYLKAYKYGVQYEGSNKTGHWKIVKK